MVAQILQAEPGHDDPRLLLLSERDNVLVARQEIAAGDQMIVGGQAYVLSKPVLLGHKVARSAISEGAKVIKYGVSIGSAVCPIVTGDHVHTHNLKSDYTKTHVIKGSESL